MPRVKVNITIEETLLEELEKEREITVGDRKIIEDRSHVYEKMLIMGLCEHKRNKTRLDVLERIKLERLNLEKIDLKKLVSL